METREILQRVRDGVLSITEAERYFQRAPFVETQYAKLDVHRRLRTGRSEVVFCSGKTDEALAEIFDRLFRENGEVLGTRASPQQYAVVRRVCPDVVYDPIAHLLKIEPAPKVRRGNIVVCTGGTADLAVAEEAAQTAEFFGSAVTRVYDVGVSGLHRLLSYLEIVQSAHCVIVAAGMEGALASVVGGLVENPVIAVPTSVGYGASFHGLSALLSMLNSCANGVATVNIDNGYGAGYLAAQINRLALHTEEGCGDGM